VPGSMPVHMGHAPTGRQDRLQRGQPIRLADHFADQERGSPPAGRQGPAPGMPPVHRVSDGTNVVVGRRPGASGWGTSEWTGGSVPAVPDRGAGDDGSTCVINLDPEPSIWADGSWWHRREGAQQHVEVGAQCPAAPVQDFLRHPLAASSWLGGHGVSRSILPSRLPHNSAAARDRLLPSVPS
jgi:hypothetical protein